ncbi:hypothetical protein K7G19_07260 [Cupriavidus sp. DB3]|uniref:STY1053 family phage-associated protein n=1 Tax=Cupriavidus sp. DB3 TaxID=2873259 RepID=UPI001CF2C676|nr:hypothetical protein [Cupriavidus sp. DB3]MCA7083396.1 hypothetical protein [Cupriavidus sp. DB3]
MAKVKIHVAKAFKLLGKDGKQHDFPVGNHTVDQDVADHWFVKAHLGGEAAQNADTEAAADELPAELEAKAKALQATEADLAAREKYAAGMVEAMTKHAADLDQREAKVAEREKAVAEREQAIEAKAKEDAEAKAKAEAEAKPAAKTSK